MLRDNVFLKFLSAYNHNQIMHEEQVYYFLYEMSLICVFSYWWHGKSASLLDKTCVWTDVSKLYISLNILYIVLVKEYNNKTIYFSTLYLTSWCYRGELWCLHQDWIAGHSHEIPVQWWQASISSNAAFDLTCLLS